jgi:hypothetical protein
LSQIRNLRPEATFFVPAETGKQLLMLLLLLVVVVVMVVEVL